MKSVKKEQKEKKETGWERGQGQKERTDDIILQKRLVRFCERLIRN